MAQQQNPNVVSAVTFDNEHVYVTLADGRIIGNPLNWHPWLANATPEQRQSVEFYELGLYFPDLDEGLDVEGMLKGLSLAATKVS